MQRSSWKAATGKLSLELAFCEHRKHVLRYLNCNLSEVRGVGKGWWWRRQRLNLPRRLLVDAAVNAFLAMVKKFDQF